MHIISLKYREKAVPINQENEGFDSSCFAIHLIFAEPLVLCKRNFQPLANPKGSFP